MKKLTLILLLVISFQLSYSQTLLDTAVNFSVKDIYGNNIELFPILDEGKVVVIDFFSTTCGFCILYTPDIQASYEDFGENQGDVYFLKIAWGDDNAGVAYFDSLYSVTIPSVSGSEGGGNQVYNNYQVQATPTVIVIRPDRVIDNQFVWEPTTENINAAVVAAGGTLVGLDEMSALQELPLHVYPNPSKGIVSIQLDLEQSAIYGFEVFDLSGNKVYENPGLSYSAGQHSHKIDLSALPSGTYFIRQLKNGKQERSGRIILLD